MVTVEGQIVAVRRDGMGMQAVDGAAGRGALDGPGSRCRWTAVRCRYSYPGTGLLRRDFGGPGGQRLDSKPWPRSDGRVGGVLVLTASCAAGCNAFPVGRGGGRGGDGVVTPPHRSKERRLKVRVKIRGSSAGQHVLVLVCDGWKRTSVRSWVSSAVRISGKGDGRWGGRGFDVC